MKIYQFKSLNEKMKRSGMVDNKMYKHDFK